MIDRVEVAFEINLDQPFDRCPLICNALQRRMAGAIWGGTRESYFQKIGS